MWFRLIFVTGMLLHCKESSSDPTPYVPHAALPHQAAATSATAVAVSNSAAPAISSDLSNSWRAT
uniref:Uncharacterized protein n=1 Tax=Arundo donax TaxID=35708 RepID=A0A0A8YWB2_ARUDO